MFFASRHRGRCLLITVSLCLLQGCLFHPGVDVNEVQRLHESLAARGVQHRGSGEMGLLQPAEQAVPPLKITRDKKSGRHIVHLTLEDAITRALATNTDIAVTAFEPSIARERVVQAAAAFDPEIFGSVGYSTNDSPVTAGTNFPGRKTKEMSMGLKQRLVTGAEWSMTNTFSRTWTRGLPGSTSRFYTNDLEFQIAQPLLRNAWPAVNLAEFRIANLDHKISFKQFREQVEQTIYDVIAAYHFLFQARREVEIAERLLKNARETLKRVKDRGIIDATIVTVKQAEAAMLTRQATLEDAKKTLGDIQDQLARLIPDKNLNLIENYQIIPLTPLNDAKVKIDATDRLLTALAKNPTLEQVRLAIQKSEISLKVAENQTLPELNISAGTTVHGGNTFGRHQVWQDFRSGRFLSYWTALEFTYPLGNRGPQAALSESRQRRLQVITQMQNIADKVAQSVRQSIRNVDTSYKQLQAQRKAAKAIQEELDGLLALEKDLAKLTPEFLNLKLRTQEELARAESAVLRALVGYNNALVELDRVCGTLLDRNKVDLALPAIGGR